MGELVRRAVGAAKLDVATYNEVEADGSATSQALLLVLLSSLASGLGSGAQGFLRFFGGAVVALIAWGALAFVIYMVGTKMLPEPQTEADWGQLLRVLGFASTPGILSVAGVVPGLGVIVPMLVFVWTLIASVIGVREALDYSSTGRAVGVCVIGYVVYILVGVGLGLVMVGLLFGTGALMGG